MNKKKSCFMKMLIAIIAILYLFCFSEVLQADTEFIESSDLFFSAVDSDGVINELVILDQEKVELKLHNTNQEINEVTIMIPNGLNFDLVETQKLIEQEFPMLEKKESFVAVEETKIKIQFAHLETVVDAVPLVFSGKQRINENGFSEKLLAVAKVKEEEYRSQDLDLIFTKNIIENSIQPRAGDLNIDLHLESVYSSIEAGTDGIFQLNFKVTGSQVSYEDAMIKIQLPTNALFDQELEHLKLADVIPVYDEQTHTLSYFFEQLNSGVSFTQLFKVQTENGFVKDGTELKATAEFIAPDYFEDTHTEAVITILSGLTLTSDKEYLQTYTSSGAIQDTVPVAGNTGEWQIKVNIPKKDTGQLYIQEDSKIVVKDQLPTGLTYVEDSLGGKYDASTRTVTWEFDAPSLAEQQLAEIELFSQEITIRTKFPTKLTQVETYTNKLLVYVEDLSTQTNEVVSSAFITAFPPSSSSLPAVNGTNLYPVHSGPLDGQGNLPQTAAQANPNPTVYSSALLKFAFQTSVMNADSPNKPFEKYDVTYKIDNNLDLKALFIRSPLYAPNATYNSTQLPDSAAQKEIYVTVNGKEQLLLTNPVSQRYSLEELGVTEHVSQVRIHYTYRAAGSSQLFNMEFGIKEGYSGQVKNYYGFDFTGYDKNGKKTSHSQTVTGAAVWQYSEPRTANVVKAPSANNVPIVSNTIDYQTEENGIVISGPNRVEGSFKNEPTSLVSADGSFDTYVLLSQGVSLNTKEPDPLFSVRNPWVEDTGVDIGGTVSIKDENYLNQERQLLHIHWDRPKLAANETLTYGFNILIDDTASSVLKPEAYSFLGNSTFKVPITTGISITDSVIQNDLNDLSGNGNKNEKMVKTGNQYYLANASGIIIQELVKGELDDEFSMFGHTILDGDIHYRFDLTNTGTSSISSMTLMNVLPSVGDLGITDNQPLDSMFTPLMKGPIDLPDEWDDKVDVYYSEATNPKRDDLNESVNYPSTTKPIPNPAGAQDPKWMMEKEVIDWEEIHSFMIKLKQSETWKASETMTLDFDMKAPKKLDKALIDPTLSEYERAAWNSFAFTVNGLQAVEPSKVGVVVNNEFNLQIIKEDDLESSKRLTEAEFTLFDQEKTILDTQITNEQGELRFMSMAPGTYYIQETKAPQFYELNPTVYEIEISNGEITVKNPDEFVKQTENANDEAQIKLVLSNRLKRLPSTGSKKLIALIFCGLMLVVVGIGYLIKRNQEKGR